jgi:hypothetical protein
MQLCRDHREKRLDGQDALALVQIEWHGWLDGRVPYARHPAATAELVGMAEPCLT